MHDSSSSINSDVSVNAAVLYAANKAQNSFEKQDKNEDIIFPMPICVADTERPVVPAVTRLAKRGSKKGYWTAGLTPQSTTEDSSILSPPKRRASMSHAA